MAAWIKQIASQVAKHGAKKASWYCEWDEPDGSRRIKSCGPGTKGKHLAQDKADRINSQLTLGTYESDKAERTTWGDFYKRYNDKLTDDSKSGKLRAGSVREIRVSLKHFARILNLDDRPMCYITTERVDSFGTDRRKEKGKNPGSKISPATLNKDLRHIKAALSQAKEWKFLDEMPKVEFDGEPEKLPTYIDEDDFAKIYAACDKATTPDCPAGPAAWWRALLVFCQMTGWRIGETLALRWDDVDLDKAQAVTRAAFNKGKRDEIASLHPIVIEHLKPLRAFHDHVFAWPECPEYLYDEFARIQDEAGIKIECPNKHFPWHGECTDCCTRYSFHDERRAFATNNALNMNREALQKLMRHKSPETTAKYINMAKQLNPAVQALHVPAVLKTGATG
jgi:integrase